MLAISGGGAVRYRGLLHFPKETGTTTHCLKVAPDTGELGRGPGSSIPFLDYPVDLLPHKGRLFGERKVD